MTRLACVRTTPFGSPLVPLEYGSSARSFGVTRTARAGPSTASRSAVKSSSVMRIEAPESASWRSTSGRVAAGLMPVTAPPRLIAASATPAHGAMFGALIASTSPGPKPRAASSAATRSTRADSAPYVRPSIARRSGCRAAVAPTSSWKVVPPASTGA